MALVLLPVPVSSPVPLAPIVIGSLKGANKRTWMDFVASGAAHELYDAASPAGADKKYRPLRPTPPGSAASRSPSRERAPASGAESKPRRRRQTSRKRARTACIPCRERKVKCEGAQPGTSCTQCGVGGASCHWPEEDGRSTEARRAQLREPRKRRRSDGTTPAGDNATPASSVVSSTPTADSVTPSSVGDALAWMDDEFVSPTADLTPLWDYAPAQPFDFDLALAGMPEPQPLSFDLPGFDLAHFMGLDPLAAATLLDSGGGGLMPPPHAYPQPDNPNGRPDWPPVAETGLSPEHDEEIELPDCHRGPR
ncbi:hypothetical protein Q8F55_003144 [Vanrija albida]|uniref:Zn(2)-C6 fungal-type domain-containing protein n=1 Tax=Vanrija albida TaxID=181172 RepID=A0ABR3QCQ0_9TREE